MAETKKALFLERINRLSFQIDFLTEQRTKLTAEKTLQDNLITKFHESAYPNMILLQSLILSWFQQLNQMDQLILDNITNRMQEKIVDMDKILVNYLGIFQLRSRISQTNNQIQQETQLQQFSENLDQFRQSQEKLKNTLYDELLFQYNTIIDESTEQFQDQFQEIIKLLDSFQIMMAKMHTLIPKELIFSLDESTSKIQDVEDHIENFRKPIHFGGEPVILQLVDNFDANLNQILSYVDNFSDVSFDVVESMNDAYGNLKSIQETFLISLEIQPWTF